MSHLDEWQLFSNRYGRNLGVGADPWMFRHRYSTHPLPASHHRCVCPGTCPPVEPSVQRCGLRATQEDLLCNECRQWCYAIDNAGNHHQFASLARR